VIILVNKLLLQSVKLQLSLSPGVKAKIFGLGLAAHGLGLITQDLGLGLDLIPCGLVNITVTK